MNNDSLKVFNNWIACADEDLELSRRELNYIDEEILIRSVCFHCQQAVEKYFKAFLILHNKNFRKTHDLDELKILCLQFDKAFEIFDVTELSLYAVEARYPDFVLIPNLDDVKKSFELASQVREFIFKTIREK